MGGSKLLDRFDNLMMVCAQYNGAMESDFEVAQTAREQGHKLTQWDNFDRPVFDNYSRQWYRLLSNGEKELVNDPESNRPLF